MAATCKNDSRAVQRHFNKKVGTLPDLYYVPTIVHDHRARPLPADKEIFMPVLLLSDVLAWMHKRFPQQFNSYVLGGSDKNILKFWNDTLPTDDLIWCNQHVAACDDISKMVGARGLESKIFENFRNDSNKFI